MENALLRCSHCSAGLTNAEARRSAPPGPHAHMRVCPRCNLVFDASSYDKAVDPLFSGVFPTGISYCDRRVEEHGDYKRCALLSFSTLELDIRKGCSSDLKARIIEDAAKIQARRGEQYQVSGSGQTITLGHGIK
jgi:hypothetical protein